MSEGSGLTVFVVLVIVTVEMGLFMFITSSDSCRTAFDFSKRPAGSNNNLSSSAESSLVIGDLLDFVGECDLLIDSGDFL